MHRGEKKFAAAGLLRSRISLIQMGVIMWYSAAIVGFVILTMFMNMLASSPKR